MGRKRKKRNQYEFITRKFPKIMQKKLAIQFIIIVLAFACLLGKITYINADKGSQYTQIVLDQQSYTSTTLAYERGEILDANGTVLASSERVYNVILDVKALLSATSDETKLELYIEETTAVLVEVFGIDESDIESAIENSPTSQYKILAKEVDYTISKIFESYEDDNESYPK